MSNSLRASRFPFCAVVMAATNHRIALLQQIEGPRSPEEMLLIVRVLEESSPVLVADQHGAEERLSNLHLREEEDAVFRAVLEADQRIQEQVRLEKEAAEAERKHKEEVETRERAARVGEEKLAALVKMRQEKAQSLGAVPEKGPNVTWVPVRCPNGERKERRFHETMKIPSLYD